MHRLTRIISASALLLIGGLPSAAFPDAPTSRLASTAPAASQPSGVLEPVRESATQPADAPAEMREGTMTELVGQITYNARHEAMLRFREHEGGVYKTLEILPNRSLARMEAALATRGKDTWFRVSVLVTVYQNHNYLLIRDASFLLEKP